MRPPYFTQSGLRPQTILCFVQPDYEQYFISNEMGKIAREEANGAITENYDIALATILTPTQPFFSVATQSKHRSR